MGLLPEWFNKGETPTDGQYTQSNIFTNPVYNQQPKAGRLAQALMNPNQPQMQPQMQQPQGGMMLNPNNQLMTNWNQQYGSY